MKQKYWAIVVVILAVIVGCFVISQYQKLNQLKTEIKQIREEFGEAVGDVYDLQQTLKLNFENDFLLLDKGLIVQTENHHSILLKDLIQENTLIFRFSTASCMTCIKETADILNQYLNKDWKVIVLSNHDDPNYIKFIKEYLNITQDIYCVKNLLLPIDESHLSYLFVVDNDLKVGMLFSPLKKFPDLTMKYIHCVVNKPLFN